MYPTTPILFSNSHDETESLVALAKVRFQYALDNSPRHLSIGEVFPQLCSIAAQLGKLPYSPVTFDNDEEARREVEQLELDSLVRTACSVYPSAVRSMLEVPLPNAIPASPMTTIEHPREVPKSITPVETALVQPIPTATVVTPDAKTEQEASSRGRKDVAYEITQTLLSHVTVKILGEAIYAYNGKFYAHMTAENLRRLIMGCCREEVAKEGNARLVDEIYRLILCEPQICDNPENINTNLVSFQNGVLDIKGHCLLPHDPRHNTYYALAANYQQDEYHPVFDRFLNDITGGNPILRQRIMEVMGYCLVPDITGKFFFVYQGVKDSGKSVLARFIQGCFNREATVAQDVLSLGERFATSTLLGKQLCTSMDMPSTPLNAKAVSTFKMLTGGDPITADVKYRSAITFINTAKFILGTNHLLLTQQADEAFFHRAVAVPFYNSIPRGCQDHSLLDKLALERDAIVCSAIRAYYDLRSRNYQFTGDFPINEIFLKQTEQDQPRSIDEALQDFAFRFFEADTNGMVFVQTIQGLFEQKYHIKISAQQFSNRFLDACSAVGYDGVQKMSKGRREPGANPQARISGVRLSPLVLEEF